jgi:hypothetical protein
MATTIKNLSTGAISNVVSVLYTAPSIAGGDAADTTAGVTAAGVVNSSASDVTLSLWAPQGGAAGISNIILNALTIPARTDANGGFLPVAALRGVTLNPGGTIQAQASTAGVLTLTINGYTRT